MIALSNVIASLAPWLGSGFLRAVPMLTEGIYKKLIAATMSVQALHQTQTEITDMIAMAVRGATGGRMLIRLDDGTLIRVLDDDFEIMADDVMDVLFAQIPVSPQNLIVLREYSLHESSLSAIKAICTRFEDLATEEEITTLKKTAVSCHPEFRWRGWLR